VDGEYLITPLKPPPNRIGRSDGEREHRLYEGAAKFVEDMG
jgi:hypothetical protein